MSNDPQVDLVYSILSFDVYNRGYGSGVTILSDNLGEKIGNYSIYRRKGDAEAET